MITPGFVATPLTAGNDFPMPALLTPEEAAAEIVRGWERGSSRSISPSASAASCCCCGLLPHSAYFALVRRFTGL